MMYLCSAVQVRSTPQSGSVAARSEVSMQNVFFFFCGVSVLRIVWLIQHRRNRIILCMVFGSLGGVLMGWYGPMMYSYSYSGVGRLHIYPKRRVQFNVNCNAFYLSIPWVNACYYHVENIRLLFLFIFFFSSFL